MLFKPSSKAVIKSSLVKITFLLYNNIVEFSRKKENFMYKSVGIIAEYNPFHTGHLYQTEILRSKGYENIAVAMSKSRPCRRCGFGL